MKLLKKGKIDLDAMKTEVNAWSKASGHQNVLTFIMDYVSPAHLLLASEYVKDGSLSKWLEDNGGRAPTIKQACEIVIGILEGLAHIHRLGIVHRDLKPHNVLLRSGRPLIADFGLARILRTHNETTRIMGTPSYMAPEVWEGTRGEAGDLWAVGVMLYEMICGKKPFVGDGEDEIRREIQASHYASMPNTVPDSIRQIIDKALQKTSNRYRVAQQMLDDLKRASLEINELVDTKKAFDNSNTPSICTNLRQSNRGDEPSSRHRLYLTWAVVILTGCVIALIFGVVAPNLYRNLTEVTGQDTQKSSQAERTSTVPEKKTASEKESSKLAKLTESDQIKVASLMKAVADLNLGIDLIPETLAIKLVLWGDPEPEATKLGQAYALQKVGDIEFHPGRNLAYGDSIKGTKVMLLSFGGNGFGSNKNNLTVVFIPWEKDSCEFGTPIRIQAVDSVQYPGFVEYHSLTGEPGYLMVDVTPAKK